MTEPFDSQRRVLLRAKLIELAERWEASADQSAAQTKAKYPDTDSADVADAMHYLSHMMAQQLRELVERELP